MGMGKVPPAGSNCPLEDWKIQRQPPWPFVPSLGVQITRPPLSVISVGQLVTVASANCQCLYLDSLDILTANFWAFFRRTNSSRFQLQGVALPP